jgi:hypothetical protein
MPTQIQATSSTITLKSVLELLGTNGQPARYWIPAYQRGYRWTGVQVTQLLDDIWAFIQSPATSVRGQFYCLQPIVVKRRPSGLIEVVDGQQRLTTVHIILTCLKDVASLLVDTFFQLSFETRDDPSRPSLDTIEPTRANDNVDYYHVCQAYQAVLDWCAADNRTKSHRVEFLRHLLNADDVGRNVRVIWFELGPKEDAVDAFTRLNVGKIRLTNDELIRALFLGGSRAAGAKEKAIQVQIAYEWDLIEKGLQSPDFWAFFTEDPRKENRIGYLFELIAKADGVPAETQQDEYWVFHLFHETLQKSTREDEWLRIKKEFMRLQEWFEDERRVAFHIIGFLVTQSVDMLRIRAASENSTKSEFHRHLRDLAYECLTRKKTVPAEAELRADLKDYLDGLEYPDARIRSALLLFNIASLLENSRSNLKFNFAAFKDRNFGWDLEHIRSVASDNIKDRPGWLRDCLRFLNAQPDAESRSLAESVDVLLALVDGVPKDRFLVLRQSILQHLGESTNDEERDDISNLTLLDSRTNRGYKNSPFAVKRHTILSLDKAGVFVPLCTRNVFLKAYSAHVGDAILWSSEDGDDYERAIHETLVGFFLGKEAAQ